MASPRFATTRNKFSSTSRAEGPRFFPPAEARSFATLLHQTEELGSSLTQSLRAYSDDMRNKRMMLAEEKAYALPAKMVLPLTLFVFPVLMVALMLPVVISVSRSGF